jgi:hypothetical protein
MPVALYCVYEYGRFDGGYDRLMVSQWRRELRVQIEHLEKANASLRAKLAELQTGHLSHQQESKELARTVGELQAQVERQSQDLAFYRGIVGSTTPGPNVKVQRFAVLRGDAPGHYRLQIVLVQAVRPDNIVAGTMGLAVLGTERGRPVTYELARLTADKRAQLPFSFRYFQDLNQQVALPSGFEPSGVTVELRTSGHNGVPISQRFSWYLQES